MGNNKMIKTAAAVALGASVVATSVAPGAASAAATYKVKSGKLVTVKTGKVVKGFKTFNKVLYKDGKKFTGLRSGKYYKAGKLATGTYKGKYYSKGTAFTGLKSGVYYKAGVKGTGVYKSVYYKAGKKGTGLVGGVYYKNGAKGTGSYKGIQYKSGKAVTGVVNDVYFNNGVKATAVVEGVQYVDGDVANEVYKGVLYVDGKAAQGEVEGVLYKDGNKVTDTVEGVIYEDGKVFSGVKDGKVYLDGKLDEEAPAIEVEAAQTVAYGATAPTAASLVKSVTDNSGEKIEATATITFDGKEVSAIDTKVAGEYTINYVAVDKTGNEGKASVKVTVLNPAVDVTAVTSITATGVTVDFTALTGDQANVTVEVIDNNGKKVEVTPVLLADGSKSAEFQFKNTLTGDFKKGIWTVNGKEYNFDVLNQFDDIIEASKGTNEIKFQAALDAAGITYKDATKMSDYLTKVYDSLTPVAPAKAPTTLADIQKLINSVDEEKATEAEKVAKVKAVYDAKTQAALLTALQANFTQVNADWIVEYADNTTIKPTTTPVTPTAALADNIQAAIYTVNDAEIAKVKPTTVATQQAKTALIEKWMKADDVELKQTAKADAIEASKLVELQFAVVETKTATTLTTALTNYAKAIATKTNPAIKVEDVKVANKEFYADEFDATILLAEIAKGTTDAEAELARIITDGNSAAATSVSTNAVAAVNALTTTSTNAEVLAALKAVQALNEKATSVVDANAAEYKAKVLAAGSTLNATTIENLVQDVNAEAEAKAYAATHKAILTKTDVKAADLAAALSAQAAYDKLSAKAAAAYDDLVAEAGSVTKAAATQVTAAKTAFATEFVAITKAEDAVKAIELLDNKFFAKLTAAQKLEVAQLVIDATHTGFADIEAEVTTSTAVYKTVLNDINTATKLAELTTILSGSTQTPTILGVTPATASLIADAIFTGKPAAGYTTLAEITAQYK